MSNIFDLSEYFLLVNTLRYPGRHSVSEFLPSCLENINLYYKRRQRNLIDVFEAGIRGFEGSSERRILDFGFCNIKLYRLNPRPLDSLFSYGQLDYILCTIIYIF